MVDDRIRELEIMIRLIDIEIILVRFVFLGILLGSVSGFFSLLGLIGLIG